jgi:glycosyltransferase involved in cell wall biosynthesis
LGKNEAPMEQIMKISLIICTHNPREDYLNRTLQSLKEQSLPMDQWELLLIDNASNVLLSEKWDLSWHPNASHIRENNPGLTNARIRSINEAKAQLLVYVDDDNILESTYLEETLRISNDWNILGAWGGQQFPEFENGEPLEHWKQEFWTGKLDRDIWSNNYDREAAPVGMGLCIRKIVAKHYLKVVGSHKIRVKLDRTGKGLNSGGDIDLAYCACDLNLGIARFKSLSLIHLIPANRVTDDYLYRLCEGFGYSQTILKALRGKYPVIPSRIDLFVNRYKSIRAKNKPSIQASAWTKGMERAVKTLQSEGLI